MTEAPIHASAVARGGWGLLILGPSGAGKSALSLLMMSLGCQLIADDRTVVAARGGQLWASAPEAIRGRIEARGVGVLTVRNAGVTPLAAAVDLAHIETARLPPERRMTLCGLPLRCFHKVDAPYFAAALVQYLEAVQTRT